MGFTNTMAKLPLPNLKKNKFHLPSVNCTTQDFFNLKPVYCREVVPGEDVKINMSAFSRLSPMVKPAYARCNMVNRAFFVPYRVIFPDWNDFITESQNKEGVVPASVPMIDDKTLRYLFYRLDMGESHPFANHTNSYSLDDVMVRSLTSGNISLEDYLVLKADFIIYGPYSQVLQDWVSEYGDGYDYSFTTSDGKKWFPYAKYSLSPRGRRAYDTLVNLGYNFEKTYFINAEVQLDGNDNPQIGNIVDNYFPAGNYYSALPLLALLKVWFDWFSNQNLAIFEIDGHNIREYFNCEESSTLSSADITRILTWLDIYSYPKDYFNLATRDAFLSGPNIDNPQHTIPDITLSDDFAPTEVANAVTDTPTIRDSNGDSLSNISQFMINALQRLTDYMLRNNIVGGRTLDRMLSQYGVKLDSEKLRRSIYLGKYEQPLQIMDVTQTAPTSISGSLQPLGDYAGKGVTQGGGNFELTRNDEFGQLIIISSIIPEVSYYQGVKREMRHLSKGEFFWPEFDSIGMQLMRSDEVMNTSPQGNQWSNRYLYDMYLANNARNRNQAFGFVPRFAEYKQSDNQDVLSGDFRLPTSSGTLMYYNLFRDLLPYLVDTGYLENSTDFSTVTDGDQYDRIFSDTTSSIDHFISFFSFDVTAYKPMLPLYDSFDFGDDNEHNRKTKVSVGGTRFE